MRRPPLSEAIELSQSLTTTTTDPELTCKAITAA